MEEMITLKRESYDELKEDRRILTSIEDCFCRVKEDDGEVIEVDLEKLSKWIKNHMSYYYMFSKVIPKSVKFVNKD